MESRNSGLTPEALLVLFAGLSACEKSAPEAQPEPAFEPAPAQSPDAKSTTGKAPIEAKEVPGPAASGSGGPEKGCAPGGCAPGACGGSKK